MLQMDSAEWSMDFAFPLLSLLRANGSHEIVKQRILDICELNNQLQKCLEICPKSVEKQILFYGMDPWREICSNLDVHFKLLDPIPCWQQNIDALILGCYTTLTHCLHAMLRNTENTVAKNKSSSWPAFSSQP
uniref:Uncharacterized protein n=1 Tax=Ditylenchus dipsaci TaxID=166011 RepID=A0A915DX87_9BILA